MHICNIKHETVMVCYYYYCCESVASNCLIVSYYGNFFITLI